MLRLLDASIRVIDLLAPASGHRARRRNDVSSAATQPAKSQQSPANLFRDATLQFTVAGGSVTIADVVMDENGRTNRNTNTLVVDGVAHGQQYGYAVTSRWMTPRHLRAAMTKDGEPRGHVDYRVAEDGRTMTLSTVDSVIHFEKTGRTGR